MASASSFCAGGGVGGFGGFCVPEKTDLFHHPRSCASLAIHDAAHVLLFAFVLVRMCYVSCCAPKIRELATTGKLMQLIKILTTLFLAILPLTVTLGQVWQGFEHGTWDQLHQLTNSAVGIDIFLRSVVWAMCLSMLILVISESILGFIEPGFAGMGS